MNPFGGRCFRDVALCKFAGLKRRVWGLREKCRLMKPLPTWHSSSEELGREKYFVPRMEIGHAAHLTELLSPSGLSCVRLAAYCNLGPAGPQSEKC